MTAAKVGNLSAARILAPIGIILAALAFVVSSGMFIIDEFVVMAGAQAVHSTGTSIVENGWSEFSSPDQKLWLLVAGPNGLASQYPAGAAFLSAPLLGAFGMRGLMLPNVLAGMGTLFALWALAKRHFGGAQVALVSVLLLLSATFWLEYVYAIWPHSVSVFCIILAFWLILDCLDVESQIAAKAIGAGAAIGLGFLFRTDTFLALAALGLIAITFAKRPFRIGIFVGLGLLPFIFFAAGANLAKFGTLNPLSYGPKPPGGTSLFSHLLPITVLALISVLLLASRFVAWRPRRREWNLGVAAVALIVVAAVASGFAQRYLAGAWALLIDSTVIDDPRPGVRSGPAGVLSFWGYWKKSLGQSMPWLGLLLLAVQAPKDVVFRRLIWIVLIFSTVWSLPFFLKAWHGGMGSNMRYLLPLVPMLCALSARLLIDFARPMTAAPRILMIGALAGVGLIVLWTLLHPSGAPGAQQILSTWMLGTVAGLALFAGLRWTGQAAMQVACLAAIGAGLAASTLFLAADFRQAQQGRAVAEALSIETADLPDRTLAYAPATYIARWTFHPGHIAAMPGRWGVNGSWDNTFDYSLIDKALAKGYRVLVWPNYVNDGLRERYGARLGPSGVPFPGGEFLEVAPGPTGDARPGDGSVR